MEYSGSSEYSSRQISSLLIDGCVAYFLDTESLASVFDWRSSLNCTLERACSE